MDDVDYAQLKHKKNRGKPQQTRPHLEEPSTTVYADIKTSHVRLPVEDPKLKPSEVVYADIKRLPVEDGKPNIIGEKNRKYIGIITIIALIVLTNLCTFYVSKCVTEGTTTCLISNETDSVYKHVTEGKISYTICNGTDPACQRVKENEVVKIRVKICGDTSRERGECMICPDGWLRHNESCYNILSGGEYRTWKESREMCEEMGAHLLVIEDREQEKFIKRSSILQKGQTKEQFWIGLYRDGDGWRWVDGRLYNTSLFQISGEDKEKDKDKEKCIQMHVTAGYYNGNCQSKQNWICQKKGLKI